MGTIDKNFTSEQISGILERYGNAARIRYGFNSGGYENFVYFVTADGGALFIDTVIAEIDRVDFTDPDDPQWHIIGHQVNYEDADLVDGHTGDRIPSAYA